MRFLVVYCHPVAESFCNAVHHTVVEALERAGHEVEDLDLYAADFQPVMTRQERLDYHESGVNIRTVEPFVAQLRRAEALVFVYPTWWYGLPAMLKGYLEKVWALDVAFTLNGPNQVIRPALQHIRRLGGVSTYGASWWWTRWVGDPGRRTLIRGLKPLCHPRCRTTWLAHYNMDVSTPESRRAFLARVEKPFTSQKLKDALHRILEG